MTLRLSPTILLHKNMSLKTFTLRASLARSCTFTRHIIPQRNASFKLGPTASPPRLPEEEQKIFEELQRKSTGAFSQPQSEDASSTSTSSASSSSKAEVSQLDSLPIVEVKATGNGDELHPHMRRGAPPEFEGDTNPKTGEVGGPKNEPLRWGAKGDWTYNGRTTDF
jgi:hypothetical protein